MIRDEAEIKRALESAAADATRDPLNAEYVAMYHVLRWVLGKSDKWVDDFLSEGDES